MDGRLVERKGLVVVVVVVEGCWRRREGGPAWQYRQTNLYIRVKAQIEGQQPRFVAKNEDWQALTFWVLGTQKGN